MMVSSRSSSRIKKKRDEARPKNLTEEICEAAILKIGESSIESPEAFIEAFDGLTLKHLESFFKGLSASQSSNLWSQWVGFFSEQDPVRLDIFITLLRSYLLSEKNPIPAIHSLIKKLNPLLSSHDYSEQIKQHISTLCEKLLKHIQEGKNIFLSHLLLYLLKKNGNGNFSTNTAKRILSVLGHCSDFENTHMALKSWINQTIGDRAYFLNKEGVKCLSLLVVKSKYDYGKQIHEMTRSILPGMSLDNVITIGDLYKKIWLKYDEAHRDSFQQNCIQDLMYHGVLGNRNLPPDVEIVPQIQRLLDPFHQDKSNKSIQAMLYHLWEPILWRNLKAANPLVRCSAAEFLFRTFPCEDPFLNLEERALSYENQIKIMKDLLLDQESSVRLIAVKGVTQVLASYWAFLTSDSISEFVGILIKRSSRDGDSVQARIAVLNGLADILKDAPASHAYLKNVLPKVGDSLFDVNENVRLAMLDLLSVVKGVKYITYWEICPLDDLLQRLATDNSSAVCRRLVRLIFNSFFPIKESESIKLERCVFLIEKNCDAAKRFYEHSVKYMKLVDAVKFMLSILVSFKRHLSVTSTENESQSIIEDEDSCSDKENVAHQGSGNSQQLHSSHESSTMTETSNREETDAFISDFDIMHNFLDIITIMWISRYEELIKEEHMEYLVVLEKKTTKIMTNMFRIYKGTDMSRKIIYICSLFSQGSVNTIVRHCLNNLRNAEFQDFEVHDRLYRKSVIPSWNGQLISKEPEDYSIFIDALCNWKKGQDLLEFVLYGIEKGLENLSKDLGHLAQSSKRRKSVRFIERDQNVHLRSIYYLSYIFRHSINKQRVISKNLKELKDIYAELSKVMIIIEAELESPMFCEDNLTQEYVYFTWETYLKTLLILEDSKEAVSLFAIQGIKLLDSAIASKSKLKSPVSKAFILFLSNAFTLSKVVDSDEELLMEICTRIPIWLSLEQDEDDAFEICCLCTTLLGETFEWSLVQPKDFETSLPGLHTELTSSMIKVLSNLRLTTLQTSLIRDFKSSFCSLLESVRLYSQSPNSFYNLLKSISQVILKELTSSMFPEEDNSEVELPKIDKAKDLPVISSLFINTLYPKYIKHFLEELRISLQLKSLKRKDVLSLLCFLYVLAFDKELSVSKSSLSDCLTQLELTNIQKDIPSALEVIKSIRDQVTSASPPVLPSV